MWGARYPALIRMWCWCWSEFLRFLDHDTEVRPVLCSTSAIESFNAPRGRFPSEAAELKCLYLVTAPSTRWAVCWKPAFNALAVTFVRQNA
jgi:putative transposase